MSWPCLGLGLLLLLAGTAGGPEEKKTGKTPVPLYTNDDLERVSSHRDETGVNNAPAAAPPPAGAPQVVDASRTHAEAYWRRQAEQLHVRLQKLRERIEDLRARIAERETTTPSARSRRSRAASDTQIEGWRRQLAALEARL